MSKGFFLLAFLLAVRGGIPAWSQSSEEDSQSGPHYSHAMNSAIRSFNEGNDSDAMDRFMDILVHGSSSERTLANNYLNLITQRMNAPTNGDPSKTILGGAKTPKAAGSRPPAASKLPQPAELEESSDSEPHKVHSVQIQRNPRAPQANVKTAPKAEPVAPAANPKPEAEAPVAKPNPPAPPAQSARASEGMSEDKRAQMRKEIEARIHAKAKFYLGELSKKDSIRIVLSDSNNPRAVGVPSSMLFSSGLSFTKEAGSILRNLTGLVYSLGSAQVSILPEGALTGDSKIPDMRRSMAISSIFYSAGIAPPRVKVNLVQSQADVPRALESFHGVVILFTYNQPVPLTAEHVVGEEEGPPASLGILPDSFRADKSEGVIIEFSVVEPPAGLKSWKYQLLQPESQDGGSLAPLQEVSGDTPQFHQIFWNGRKGYFGDLLPPGRYQAVLSASDSKNRTRILQKWIMLEGPGSKKGASFAMNPSPAAHSEVSVSPAVNKKMPRARIKSKKARTPASKPSAAVPVAIPATAATPNQLTPVRSKGTESSPRSEGAVTYKISFAANTQNITAEGERQLSYVADAMTFYPQENLNLVGYAGANEPDAANLAANRAKQVASLLVSKYGVDAKRIQTQSKVGASAKPEVAIFSFVNQ